MASGQGLGVRVDGDWLLARPVGPGLEGVRARFASRVREEAGCLLWTGALYGSDQLYGRFYAKVLTGTSSTTAHRASYLLFVGPLEPWPIEEPDHKCRNTLCVNPDHLEKVTRRENVLRGTSFAASNALKTRCPKGHPLSGDNLYNRPDRPEGRGRQCLKCRRETSRQASKKRLEAGR
jgi:hypothetical protein